MDNIRESDNLILGNSIIHDGAVLIGHNIIIDSEIFEGAVITESVIEKSVIGKDTTVGPYAHVKAESSVGEKCRIGNFVEIKNSTIGNGSKVSHLAYVGDATIGENCNIACGVIFCNYDGKVKRRSTVGNNVFLGSNCNVIAPSNIGDGAYIACATTVSGEIPPQNFMIGRVKAESNEKLAKKYIGDKTKKE